MGEAGIGPPASPPPSSHRPSFARPAAPPAPSPRWSWDWPDRAANASPVLLLTDRAWLGQLHPLLLFLLLLLEL